MPLEHAQPGFSPSSLSRVKACPGSPREIRKLPEEARDTTTEASIQGTRRHALAEWCARNGEPVDKAPQELDGFTLTDEDRKAVAQVWPFIREHPARTRDGLWLIEEAVEIGKHCGLEEGLVWGTSDLIATWRDRLEIVDHKFGHTLVEPDNLQMRAYAVGAGDRLYSNGVALPHGRQVKNVRLTICQPEAPKVVRSVTYPLDVLFDWAKEIRNVVDRAMDPHAPLTVGDHCRWCPARETCPERTKAAAAAVTEMFEPVNATPKAAEAPAPIASVDAIIDIAEVKMTQDPEQLSADDLGRILDQAPLIEGWLKDVRNLAQKKLAAGKPVTGYKLIEGRRTREWKYSEEELIGALKKIGLAQRDMFVFKLISPNQAEKIEKITKSRKKVDQLKELWGWKTGKPTLAPESDPAPAVDDAHQMFEPVAAPVETEAEVPSWV